MPVKVVYFKAKVWNEAKEMMMQNYMRDTLTFKIVNNPFALMEIPEVEKKLLPTLKEMFPHWFSPKEYFDRIEEYFDRIEEYFDRIDNVVVEAQPKSSYTEEEKAYERGFIDALELM